MLTLRICLQTEEIFLMRSRTTFSMIWVSRRTVINSEPGPAELALTPDPLCLAVYNNGTSIQLVCFLAAEFPMIILIKRYGFKTVLPFLMFAWGMVSAFQAFMQDTWSFYLTRALIGAFEGGTWPRRPSCRLS